MSDEAPTGIKCPHCDHILTEAQAQAIASALRSLEVARLMPIPSLSEEIEGELTEVTVSPVDPDR